MRFGDLSNVSSPRIYVVFDDAIGTLPEDAQEFYELVEERRFKEAVDLFTIDTSILNKINYLAVRKGINVYLVTWMGQSIAGEIEEFLDELMIPIRGVISTTPNQLGRTTAQDETIIGIFDPDPENMLKYGAKGVILKK